MAAPFPFNLNADKYSRQLWDKQTYLYLAEYFRTAIFDASTAAVAGNSIDDYRHAGAANDWRLPAGGGGMGQWSGIVWYIGNLAIDYTKENNDPRGEASEFGMFGVAIGDGSDAGKTFYRGSVGGKWLRVLLRDGTCDFSNLDLSELENTDEYNYYPVAEIVGVDSDGKNIYGPTTGRVVGDIRIDMVPYHEPVEKV